MTFYDALETRSADARMAWLATALPAALARAQSVPALAEILAGIAPDRITTRAALAGLPVIRKSELSEAQHRAPPFGGFTTRPPQDFENIFQSPGPIYEPGRRDGDWWRLGRFLHAAGVGRGDILHNCFGYHLTPAGLMLEEPLLELGCAVNGVTMQASRTSDFIFPVGELIEYISHLMPMYPGDLIFTGTPEGVGATRKPPIFLKPGDVLTSWVEGIGTLTNPITEEPSR